MKVKLDECLPAEFRAIFEEFGHDVYTVEDEGLLGYDDERLWKIARNEGRLFFTLDADFAELHWREKVHHPGIVLLKLKRINRATIRRRVHSILRFENLDLLHDCIAVATETNFRVRKQID